MLLPICPITDEICAHLNGDGICRNYGCGEGAEVVEIPMKEIKGTKLADLDAEQREHLSRKFASAQKRKFKGQATVLHSELDAFKAEFLKKQGIHTE